jgi:hypothetical protein
MSCWRQSGSLGFSVVVGGNCYAISPYDHANSQRAGSLVGLCVW